LPFKHVGGKASEPVQYERDRKMITANASAYMINARLIFITLRWAGPAPKTCWQQQRAATGSDAAWILAGINLFGDCVAAPASYAVSDAAGQTQRVGQIFNFFTGLIKFLKNGDRR
jgi:hypothetical protein